MDKTPEIVNNFDELLQIVCDPENQPHQFIGDEMGLREIFEIHICKCTEAPDLNQDDKIFLLCVICGVNVTKGR
jgi:hypothetical protein